LPDITKPKATSFSGKMALGSPKREDTILNKSKKIILKEKLKDQVQNFSRRGTFLSKTKKKEKERDLENLFQEKNLCDGRKKKKKASNLLRKRGFLKKAPFAVSLKRIDTNRLVSDFLPFRSRS